MAGNAHTHSPLELLRADMANMLRQPSGGSARVLALVARVVFVRRFQAIVLTRMSQLARRYAFSRPLASMLHAACISATGAEIDPNARIGPGLVIAHSVGIVIGSQVRIGTNAFIYQGVTIGDGSRPGQPTIGDNVVLGAGSKLLGGIFVGDDVVVGANAVVVDDLPDNVTATGVPASHRAKKARSR